MSASYFSYMQACQALHFHVFCNPFHLTFTYTTTLKYERLERSLAPASENVRDIVDSATNDVCTCNVELEQPTGQPKNPNPRNPQK